MDSKSALEKIRHIVGDEIYKKITNELAGSTVYFPNEPDWVNKKDRNEQLLDDYYSGKYDIINLAQKYNLSVSRIYKIVQGH